MLTQPLETLWNDMNLQEVLGAKGWKGARLESRTCCPSGSPGSDGWRDRDRLNFFTSQNGIKCVWYPAIGCEAVKLWKVGRPALHAKQVPNSWHGCRHIWRKERQRTRLGSTATIATDARWCPNPTYLSGWVRLNDVEWKVVYARLCVALVPRFEKRLRTRCGRFSPPAPPVQSEATVNTN